MEELRSTEILDKEIEADARKKADRIVAKAESEAKSIIAGVDERVKKAVEEKYRFFSFGDAMFITDDMNMNE